MNVSAAAAFGAGLVSFVSPCVLPLIPTYITYLAGSSVEELNREALSRMARRLLLNALLFVAGFSLVFILLGVAATGIDRLLLAFHNPRLLDEVAGVVVIFFGLQLMGVFRLGFLQREKRWEYRPGRAGPLNSFLIGLAFSLGWTPCVAPILASILSLAATSGQAGYGAYLLAIYSAGLAVPFLLTAFSLRWILPLFSRWAAYLRWVTVASGALLVILGVLIFRGEFILLSGLSA